MLTIIGLFALGVLAGYFIRHKEKWIKKVEPVTGWAIYALLFLLGLSVGANPQILRNLNQIGLQAILISLGGVTGSITLSWLVYQFYFKTNKEIK
jgi:uncharacterized membrane protein YbjE (DUF340 family)